MSISESSALVRARGGRFFSAVGFAAVGIVALASATLLSGCVTVKPQERTVLADPSMQFDQQGGAKTKHALENREGSYGGNGVSGGGCGCN